MKKILFIVSILFLSAGLMNAQTTETNPQSALKPAQLAQLPEAKAKARVDEIAKLCTLKEEQKTKLNKLYVTFFTKQDELRAKKATISTEEFANQMKALKSERDAALKTNLSADQIAKLQAAKAEMKDGAAKPKQ